MNYFTEFLESSTIHGLVYISTEKRLSKLFWILVVITGFTIASMLINDAFSNWSESPIKTTIETRPISDLTFPRVTVCPPKNTFTDLNYDLMMLENMTLNSEERNEMIELAFYAIHDQFYQSILMNMSKLEEENRYYNWYHSFTDVTLPLWGDNYGGLYIVISTSALTGRIKTKYFKDQFDSKHLERRVHFIVDLIVSNQISKNPNCTLRLGVDKFPGPSVTKESVEVRKGPLFGSKVFYAVKDNVNVFNITAPEDIAISMKRQIYQEDIDNNMIPKLMPGIQLKWSFACNEKLGSYAKYSEIWNFFHLKFRRFVNILNNLKVDTEEMWNLIRPLRKSVVNSSSDCSDNTETKIKYEYIDMILDQIEKHYDMETDYGIYEDVSKDTIEKAGKIYVYIMFCHKKILKPYEFMSSLLKTQTPKLILQTLNRLRIIEWNPPLIEMLIKNLKIKWNFKVDKLRMMTGQIDCEAVYDCEVSSNHVRTLQRITNHPVHIIVDEDNYNPSAFIPFCWFGSGLELGANVKKFTSPVCNNFKTVLRNEQQCYEMDPNMYISKQFKREDLKQGLILLIDENRDRQFEEKIGKEKNANGVSIFLDAIETPVLTPGWKYNLNAVKDIKATDDYMTKDNIGCSKDTYVNCTTRLYVDELVKNCGCLPFSMNFDKRNEICEPAKIQCVKNVSVFKNSCLQSCQGLFITGYERRDFDKEESNQFMSKIKNNYNMYKTEGYVSFEGNDHFPEYKWENEIKLVAIYFDTPGYDEITKDTAAKFVDMLSAIGGTFGLLTGFSLISGIEILFFMAKFFLRLAEKKN